MSQQQINLGQADKGNGDPLRVAFDKVNDNFTELYNGVIATGVVSTSASPPVSPGVGDLWWDTNDGNLYVYYSGVWASANAGLQGPQGVQGAVGPAGIRGLKGDTGNIGPRGYTGETGAQGEVGPRGLKGDQGDPGPAGTNGVAGEQGIQGEQGPRGVKGDQGDPGTNGANGTNGETGPQGEQGEQGLPGTNGTNGLPGLQGEQGIPGTQVQFSLTAPNPITEGNVWWDMNDGNLYVHYNNQWVSAVSIASMQPDLGDWAFRNDTMYSLVGGEINNSDTTHGATASITIPTNGGNNPVVLINTYGNVTLMSGASPGALKTWNFGTEGKLTLPAGTTYEYLAAPLTGHGDGLARLDFTLATDGVNANWIAASASPAGSGYSPGDTFTFDQVFLGIPGASVTIEVLTVGAGGSVEDLAFSMPPLYPADIYRDSPINLQVGTESNRWTFGATGNLTLPTGGVIKKSDGSTYYTDRIVNGAKTVSLGTDGTLSLPAGPTLLTNVNQIVSATINRTGASTDTQAIAAAQDTWYGLEQTFADIRDQDAQLIEGGGYTRPWAGLPSWEAYPLITTYVPGETQLPAPNVIAPAANNAINAYLAYKELVSNIDIVSGDTAFSFENTGSLRVPGVITKDNSLILVSSGMSGVLPNGNSASVTADGQYGRVFIRTNNSETLRTWQFDINGALTFPDGTTTTGKSITVPVTDSLTVNFSVTVGPQTTNTTFKANPGSIKLPTGNGYIYSGGETNAERWGLDSANKELSFPNGDSIHYDQGGTGLQLYTYANPIKITSAQAKTWEFGVDGELALPTNGYTEAVIKELDATALVLFAQKAGANVKILAGATSAAGAKQWLFNGTNGNLTLPASGDVVDSTSVSQLAKRVEGSWTVTAGTNTYSFTVPADGTYTMWVKGNIPNGIITWNATLSISNTNVPAIGTQYAWNYTGGGSPILLTTIPDQIRGAAGTISTDATYAGTTSNRFDFGISNTSGSSQTIYYGYTKV